MADRRVRMTRDIICQTSLGTRITPRVLEKGRIAYRQLSETGSPPHTRGKE